MGSIFNLSETAESLLQTHGQIKHLVRKEYLLREGQYCSKIWFVKKGLLRTFLNKDGREINLDFHIENNFVTQLECLRNGTPSEVYIQILEPATVLEFERKSLENLYAISNEIATFGRSAIENLLTEKEANTHRFIALTPTERYQYLVSHRPELIQRVSLTQLSSYLGISRETLSRIRKPG